MRSPERGVALLAVLFALTLLMLLALPFAVSMSVGADAAMRDVEQTSTEQASASVRELLLADVALSHPAIDPTPTHDGLDEWPAGVLVPDAFAALQDGGRVRLGGEVVDLQRFLGLDSASPLLLANVLGTASRLQDDLEPDAGSMVLADAGNLPETGAVWVQNEVIRYGLRDGNALLQLERGLFADEGFADGSQPVPAEALVLDYRCVLATAWPFFGRGDGSRSERVPFRSVGELVEIQEAGLGSFRQPELDALAQVFAVEARAETAGVWGRPQRVYDDLQAGISRVLTVGSALHVSGGSTVRLRDLGTGAVEHALVMSAEEPQANPNLLLPSVYELTLLMPVTQAFAGVDTIVEPLLPAPVNVNTAPKEVLEAVFANVRRTTRLQHGDEAGRRQAAPPFIQPALARDLAAEVVALRDVAGGGDGPFTGWQDLVTRLFEPRLQAEGNNRERNKWLVLYRNLQTGRDAEVEMGTAPICFASGPWVTYRAAATRSRSVVAPGVVGRHERSGLAAALPGFRIERAWRTQDVFEEAFQLDRRAPYWITTPINLGHLQPGSLGNNPAPRYFPHLVPVAYPTLGLGAPRFPVTDATDAGIEPATAVVRAGVWQQTTGQQIRGYESFAQANDRRGHDVRRDGPYLMNNVGPQQQGAVGSTGGGAGGNAGGGGRRHDRIAFPFSVDGGFMGRFGMGFWVEPQTLENVYVFDHGDGDPNRNRMSVLGRDGNLVLEVIDEAGLDPNPSESPAGVQRTASQVQLPLAELALPSDTAVHLGVSASSGRPGDLSFAVDGMTRGRPIHTTWLTAAIPAFDPSLANNQINNGQPPGAAGNDRYLDVQVENTDSFPPVGVLRIGLELFEYSSISGNSFQCRWRDSLGGRGARQSPAEHFPQLPLDQNGRPTVDLAELQQQGVNLSVFPEHPAGSLVELYGYSALVSEDVPMMVGTTGLSGALGAFAVARAFIQNPRPIALTPQTGPPLNLGAGLDANWTGDLELADPTPSTAQPPPAAQQEIADAFSTAGGYALLIQYRIGVDPPLGQVASTAEVGGIEVIRYGGRNGTRLTGVQRAQVVVGDDSQIGRDIYDGTARQFVTNWQLNDLSGNSWNDYATLIVWVVPISVPVQNPRLLWDPQTTGLTEFAQLYPQGGIPEDTEWVRYDAIADSQFLVRGNRAAWRDLNFELTRLNTRESTQANGSNASTNALIAPPWGTVQPSAGFVGYTPQLESTFPQIHFARRQLKFRGDPFTGTSSHAHGSSIVMPCHRLQLLPGNYGAFTGRVGRHDRVALVQGSIASGTTRPAVEWHTVHWQARRYSADNLIRNTTPEERLGPWPFQLVGFRDAVQGAYIGPPTGTVIDDPRRFDRLVKFPSGELPAAYCVNPTLGAGVVGEQPMQGRIDEVEVTTHIAPDLVLDDICRATAQSFTVEPGVTATSAGMFFTQSDLTTAFPQGGGLVMIDGEILAYQSHQNGIFQIAQNGRGLLNTQPRDHDRGARVLFLTHRPAAILAAGVGATESALPLQDLGALPPGGGTLLLGRELLHYTWGRRQVNTVEMPRWYPPDSTPGDSRGRGLFRGRYGTVPQGASSGEPVIAMPFRYWDRYAPDSDDPELAYFQLTTNEASVFYRQLRWREETRDPRVSVLCRARTDGLADWAADAAATPGLWEFRGGSEETGAHRFDRQASRLEVRFQTVYQPGCVDLVTFRTHGWKTTARVEDVRVEYDGQSRIYAEVVTAR